MGKNKKQRNKDRQPNEQPEPLTLLKASYYSGAVLPVIMRYDTNFFQMSSIQENTKQYLLYLCNPQPHLITVTQGINYLVPGREYNLGIGITSRNQELNVRIAEDFSKKTSLQLSPAPTRMFTAILADQGLYLMFESKGDKLQEFIATFRTLTKQFDFLRKSPNN